MVLFKIILLQNSNHQLFASRGLKPGHLPRHRISGSLNCVYLLIRSLSPTAGNAPLYTGVLFVTDQAKTSATQTDLSWIRRSFKHFCVRLDCISIDCMAW